jgi:hypothetical protein
MRPDDEAECAKLANAFAYYLDRNMGKELAALFTGDGEFKRPGLVVKGHAEFIAWAERRQAEAETRHIASPPFFISGDTGTAKSVSYFTAYRARKTDAPLPEYDGPVGVAEYHDEFRKTEEGWRIARRKVFVVMTPPAAKAG